MKPIRLFALASAIASLSGCATNGKVLPVQTKAEARLYQAGEPVTLKANYLKLARHWDENATKLVDGLFAPTARWRMEIFEADQTAHIVCGNAFIDGFIELKGQPDGTTVMTTYAWGGTYKVVTGWRDMIAAAPFISK